MSNLVSILCTDAQSPRVDERLLELQAASPSTILEQDDAADDLLHHGYMLLRLPPAEIAPVIARANEILGE